MTEYTLFFAVAACVLLLFVLLLLLVLLRRSGGGETAQRIDTLRADMPVSYTHLSRRSCPTRCAKWAWTRRLSRCTWGLARSVL